MKRENLNQLSAMFEGFCDFANEASSLTTMDIMKPPPDDTELRQCIASWFRRYVEENPRSVIERDIRERIPPSMRHAVGSIMSVVMTLQSKDRIAKKVASQMDLANLPTTFKVWRLMGEPPCR